RAPGLHRFPYTTLFRSVGLGASKGVFVTTSAFTSGASEYANRLPQRIVLIDGNRLAALMIEHGVGVRTSRAIEFKRLDEDFFSEDRKSTRLNSSHVEIS